MPPTPDIPTGLCMFLRKYYENGRIASIAQLHLDRLIEIAVDVLDMSGRLVTRKIHVELMGKYSNVIFTEDGTIIEALIKTGKNKQALRTSLLRNPMPSRRTSCAWTFAFSAQELTDMMETGTDEPLKTWMLKRFNGMSTIVLNELSHDSGIDAGRPVGTCRRPTASPGAVRSKPLASAWTAFPAPMSIRSRARKSSSRWNSTAWLNIRDAISSSSKRTSASTRRRTAP